MVIQITSLRRLCGKAEARAGFENSLGGSCGRRGADRHRLGWAGRFWNGPQPNGLFAKRTQIQMVAVFSGMKMRPLLNDLFPMFLPSRHLDGGPRKKA